MDSLCKLLSNLLANENFYPTISEFSDRTRKPGHKYGKHSYEDEIEVVYILNGSIFVGIDDKYLKFKENQCLVIFPGVLHDVYLDNRESCRIFDLVFNIGSIGNIDNAYLKNHLRFLYELLTNKIEYFSFVDTVNLKDLLESIYLLVGRNDFLPKTIIKLKFFEMYLLFSQVINENYNKLTKTNNEYLKKSLQFIVNNYCNNITTNEISNFIGISSRHLSRTFVKEFGLSIQEYIDMMKLNKAKELLTNSDMNITQIAFSLNFSSSEYFSYFFKKYEKVTPREFRKANSKPLFSNV